MANAERWMGLLGAIAVALSTGCPERPVRMVFEQPLGSPSYSTPSLGAKSVAFGTESGNVFYFARDGRYLAKFQANKEVVSAPAYDADTDTFVFGSTSYVAYGTSGLGKKLWSFPTRDRIKGDPIIAAGRVYFGSYDDHFYALDLKTGRRKWIFPPRKAVPESEPAPDEAAADSEETPTEESPAPPVTPGEFAYSKPALADGVLYVGNMDGHLYALDAAKGTLRWRYRTEAPVTSSPWVEGGVVYFGSNDNHLHAVSVSDQSLKWKHSTGGWVNASPLVVDAAVYIGSDDGKLYALNAENGEVKWAFDTGGEIKCRPAVMGDLVFVTSGARQGGIWAVDRKTGTEYWSMKLDAKVESDPVVEGSRLFVTTGDGRFLGFEVTRDQPAS